MNIMQIIITILCFALFVCLFLLWKQYVDKKYYRELFEKEQLGCQIKSEYISKKDHRISVLEEKMEVFSKYKDIEDVDKFITAKKHAFKTKYNQAVKNLKEKIVSVDQKMKAVDAVIKKEKTEAGEEVIRKLQEAAQKANLILKRARDEAEKISQQQVEDNKSLTANLKEAQQKMDQVFIISNKEAAQIIKKAEERAEKVAGDALKLAGREYQLQNAIKSMKNKINGYGNEYIIPPFTLLDELADRYNFKEAGLELKRTREQVKIMIKNGIAANCDYVEINRRTTAINFVLDAFNGKVDSILSMVKHDNYGKLKQQIRDAFHLVNHNGAAFRDAKINVEFLDVRLDELKWAVAVQELKKQDREEQKRIKHEIREESRAKKEFEKAIKAAENEEKLIQKAMEAARHELLSASEAQKNKYELQLKELETKLLKAEEKNQRALSMAQVTRRGHVYVISNEGSFGEGIIKIGLTRRLEPMDRVKELGDASVPFPFDVHAIMYSEDSPMLEKKLHQKFEKQRVNKVNRRKEFFIASVAELKEATKELGIETHWTMAAEAREYRESIIVANANQSQPTIIN